MTADIRKTQPVNIGMGVYNSPLQNTNQSIAGAPENSSCTFGGHLNPSVFYCLVSGSQWVD